MRLLLLEAEIYIWERVKLETDTVKCECGDKWSDSDLSDMSKGNIADLQDKLTSNKSKD